MRKGSNRENNKRGERRRGERKSEGEEEGKMEDVSGPFELTEDFSEGKRGRKGD